MTEETKKDNWTLITEEYYERIGMVYEEERTGELFRFFGLVYGDDDYYYGLHGLDGAGLVLASCVGDLSQMGYKLLEDYVEKKCPYCKKDTLTFETYSDRFGLENVLVEGLEHYICSNNSCINDYETPQQFRARADKIHEAYEKLKGNENV